MHFGDTRDFRVGTQQGNVFFTVVGDDHVSGADGVHLHRVHAVSLFCGFHVRHFFRGFHVRFFCLFFGNHNTVVRIFDFGFLGCFGLFCGFFVSGLSLYFFGRFDFFSRFFFNNFFFSGGDFRWFRGRSRGFLRPTRGKRQREDSHEYHNQAHSTLDHVCLLLIG